ncbi:hemolysin III family protein [Comamonas piscis]|uniref:hemolysin III family protein n=1 Tax=Comamonas piscis TaxID=1562974 RepID=UPI001EE20C75|nr:hemolysin III family protein [Comamonas piscis]WSO35989.1 hemolysin III family protein [Comamonas piscis]
MQDLQSGSPHGPSVWGQPGERFNTWSHLAALPVCLAASVVLICETVAGGEPMRNTRDAAFSGQELGLGTVVRRHA